MTEIATGPLATSSQVGRRPEAIKAIPVRHPWRWVWAVAVLAVAAGFVYTVLTAPSLRWSEVPAYLFYQAILEGITVTLEVTVIAMVIGIVLGVVLAVMRVSSNPVLSWLSWFYIWFFRGTPALVQIFFWFNLAIVLPYIGVGIPGTTLHVQASTNLLISAFVAASVGLGLNEAAYMSEIVRAGIISIEHGQIQAAQALGMTQLQVMWRIIIPQAMRVIIPPTGNETIGMLKGTSLAFVAGVPELFTRAHDIASANYYIVELLIVASLWYLFMTTILTIGQYYLERHFARGSQRALPLTPFQRFRRMLSTFHAPPVVLMESTIAARDASDGSALDREGPDLSTRQATQPQDEPAVAAKGAVALNGTARTVGTKGFVRPQEPSSQTSRPPQLIRAIPVRHPWRWVLSVVFLAIAADIVYTLVKAPLLNWDVVQTYLFQSLLLWGIVVTLELTVISMAIGVALGVVLAVMRVSANPVLSWLSWFYIWFFRGTPAIVQIFFWFNLNIILPQVGLAIPGTPVHWLFYTNHLINPFIAACVGLGLNEAAYYAEIVRAGIISIEHGQIESAQALGMSQLQVMRRIIIPQAIRVIIPPTGNELIGMVKGTSLAFVATVPELFTRAQQIAQDNFAIVELLIVASLWYLFMTTILTIGQYYVERYFERGSQHELPLTPFQRFRRVLTAFREPVPLTLEGAGQVIPRSVLR